MDMIVACDNCGDTYQPELNTVPTANGGEYKSFICPHCNTEYPVCTITRRGLELREEIQHLREAIKARPDHAPRLARAMKAFDRECRKNRKPEAWE